MGGGELLLEGRWRLTMRKQLGVNELPEVVLVQPNPATRLFGDLVAPPLLLLRPN